MDTHYLIDYENVHEDGLTGCQDLGKTDHIVIFFTQNAKNIDMGVITNHGAAGLDMIEVPVGKQSADMHIGSYLGYLAGKCGNNCKVVVVSKDTDFDNVIHFWNQRAGIKASRSQQIKTESASVPPSTNNQPATKEQPATNKQPTAKEQPAAKEQPVANKQSAMNKQPAANNQPEAIPKVTLNGNGTMRAKLNQEVMQAVRSAGFDASIANNVAHIVSGLYGDEHMLSEVHNALREHYANYSDVYAAAKKVLSKYAGDNHSKSCTVEASSQNKTSLNSEIHKVLSKAAFSNDIMGYVASTAVKNLGVKNGKQQTYRSIISKYGQKKGLTIYNHIKKLI